ncbi:MAG: hypothetical protein EOO16_16570 [Chitinophagaceae bacterium]|nr:MAG: hypothetical protein EOO16_16570 [Chitinophagaceae bacterium]
MFFLLALAYRLFRNPFAAWVLLAITIVSVGTFFAKLATGLLAPWALGPDVLRGAFQLAFFAFIPMSVYLALSEYRWRDLHGQRHRVFFWPLRKCLFALVLWLLVLAGLFGFNLLVFPKAA